MTIKEKKLVYEYVVDEDTVLPLGYSRSDIVFVKRFGKLVKVIPVEVSEEVYVYLTREAEKEHKRFQRSSRCSLGSKRCESTHCEGCPYFSMEHKGGSPLSLDQLLEEGFDLADEYSASPEKEYEKKELLEELEGFIRALPREDQVLVRGVINRIPDKELMADLSILKQSTCNSRKMKMKAQLQDVLDSYCYR